MEDMWKTLGSWLFLIGIVVAILIGVIFGIGETVNANLADLSTPLGALIAVLGFLVGILSFFALGTITHERIPTFLIGALALVIIGVLSTTWTFGGNWWGLEPFFRNITQFLAVFVAPAAGLLAIRAVWDAGKTETIEKIIPKLSK